MLGVSLSVPLLCGTPKSETDRRIFERAGSIDNLLSSLYCRGVRSVELRTVRHDTPQSDVLCAVKNITDAGLAFTVHGGLRDNSNPVNDILDPLMAVFEKYQGISTVITVHPIKSGTSDALLKVINEAESRGLDIRIAVENNRRRPDGLESDSCSLVTDILNEAANKRIGACWDYGHYRWSVDEYLGGDAELLPPEKFIKNVIHTHIHALSPERQTHFPLGKGMLPLEYYCNALGRDVCYNLELEPGRWHELYDPYDELFDSIKRLRSAIPTLAAAQHDVKVNTKKYWERAFSAPDEHFTLIGPTGYIFKSGGTVLAVDPDIRDLKVRAELEDTVEELSKQIDTILITHGHVDHYDPLMLRMLTKHGAKIAVPEILSQKRLKEFVPHDCIITFHDGDTLKVGPFTVRGFRNNLHFRRNGGAGLEEFGWHITTESGKTILIPGDIRDYDADKLPSYIRGADHIFAHVWLGDRMALLDETNHTDSENFRDCADFFHDLVGGNPESRVYFAHLFESGRNMDAMWSFRHAGALMDAMYVRSPDTYALAPKPGQSYPI